MMLSEQLFLYLRTYGVGVSCLCPAGVITNIAQQIRPVGEQLPRFEVRERTVDDEPSGPSLPLDV